MLRSILSQQRQSAVCQTLFLTLICFATAAGGTTSTFDSSDEGWTIADLPVSLGNPPSVDATHSANFASTGGNPGGFIEYTDTPDGPWFWFSAPSAYLGNQSTLFGGTLSFDLMASGNDNDVLPAAILVGNNSALYYPENPPSSAWTNYAIPLHPVGWKLGDYQTGPTPTNAQMQAILGDLTAIYITGDWLTGIETAGLDNVNLVPEPSTLTLLAFSAIMLLSLRKRR